MTAALSRRLQIFLTLIAVCSSALVYADEQFGQIDLTELPFETLLNSEYLQASEAARQISEAHTAVSIVTAQDIKDFGYRSIGEILQSMPGLYVSNYGGYDLLGGRGFSSPDDYSGRIMLMIDGYVTTESYFSQIFLGEEALIDVDLIDRVEFVPGPGGTSYGASAVLGVINITTKRGSDIDGIQLSADFSNDSQQRKRLSFGRTFSNGLDVLLSASQFDAQGNHLPQDNQRLFAKASYKGLRFEYAEASRSSDTARFLLFPPLDDSVDTLRNEDFSRFLSLQYDTSLNDHLQFAAHVYKGEYQYDSAYDAFGDMFLIVGEQAESEWWGADLKFISTYFDRHRLLFGAEYKQHFNISSNTSLYFPIFDDAILLDLELFKRAHISSLYFQDEFQLNDKLTITGGLRYEKYHADTYDAAIEQDAVSPRLGFIYSPSESTKIRLSWNRASSFINAYKFTVGNTETNEFYQTRRPEEVSSTEFVWEQQLSDFTKLTAALFYNQIEDALSGASPEVDSFGQELRIEHIRPYGTRFDFSLSHQRVKNKDTSDPIYNSPEWIAKFNIAQPLFSQQWMLGLNVHAFGNRKTSGRLAFDSFIDEFSFQERGDDVGTSTRVDLTLSSDKAIKNSHISLRVENLFGSTQPYMYGSPEFTNFNENQRSVWLKYELTLP